MKLNKEKGSSPLYSQLEMIFKAQIESGEYVKGDLFPPEKSLIQQYDVSRITIRQAIDNLVQAGYLEPKRGIGTLVIFEKIDEYLKRVISFSEEMHQHGIEMSTRYCKVTSYKTDKFIANQLGCSEGDECVKLERVRCANDNPIVYSISYFRSALNMPLEELLYHDSLYEYLSKEKGIVIASAIDTLEAILADKEKANYLDIQTGVAVFKRTRKGYDPEGNLIEFSNSFYPGEKYKYSVEL